MEGSSNAVVVLGTLGIGKSTLLNRIAGGENFKTSDDAEGCTLKPGSVKYYHGGKATTVIDTAGLNDPGMPLIDWISSYNDFAKTSSNVSLCIIAFKASVRPTTENKADVITIFEAIKNIDTNNIAVVFTFCDDHNLEEPNNKGVLKWKAWI